MSQPALIDVLALHFRERVPTSKNETVEESSNDIERRTSAAVASTLDSPKASQQPEGTENGGGYSARNLMKSSSISGSKCIGVQSKTNIEVNKEKAQFLRCLNVCNLLFLCEEFKCCCVILQDPIAEEQDETVTEMAMKVASLHKS